MTYGHLQADCLYTEISSGPNARYRVWEAFTLLPLLVASDQGQVSGLCLLDLTAAFDNVDHDLLLQRVDNTFGVRDQAKEWFKSHT